MIPEENPEAIEFPIVGEDDKKRFAIERRQEKLAEAEAFEALGSKVLNIKAKAQRRLGKQHRDLGIKDKGVGQIIIQGALCETQIAQVDDAIADLKNDPAATKKDLIELHRVKLEIIKEFGNNTRLHLDADKAASEVGQHELRMAFPAGTQMAFAAGGGAAPKEIAPREIEES